MKKWLWIALLVVLLIILSCKKEKGEMEGMLHSAMDNLSSGKVSEGASLLIDAVLLTRSNEVPEKFQEKLLSAKDHFISSDFGEGSKLISEALILFKTELEGENSTPDQEPTEKTEEEVEQKVSPVAQLIKQHIMQAGEELKFGNRDKGVILVLEALELFGPPQNK